MTSIKLVFSGCKAKLARELIEDTSDRLSGLAKGASPNQSSYIRSILCLSTGRVNVKDRLCLSFLPLFNFSSRIVMTEVNWTGEFGLFVEELKPLVSDEFRLEIWISMLGLCSDVKLVSRHSLEFLGLVGIDVCNRWLFSESMDC